MEKAVRAYVKIVSLTALLSAPPCFASVVSINKDLNFDGTSTSFGFGGANLTVTNNADFFSPVSVSTQGSAFVNLFSIFGPSEPASYFNPLKGGRLIFNGEFSKYSTFVDPIVIKLSNTAISARLTGGLDENFHYGYAQLAGALLKSYGFEITLNLGI